MIFTATLQRINCTRVILSLQVKLKRTCLISDYKCEEKLRKILVADDAEFFRVRISNLLANTNVEILQATCGSQAVSIYKNEHPDLVFLDLSISNMKGIASLKKIIDFDPDAKVIMLSMIGEENAVFEAIQSGACDYLRKPLNPDFFTTIIKKQFLRNLEINKKVEGNHAAVETKFEESYAF